MNKRNSIGKEAAIALAETKWWESKTHREIAEFQMTTVELCCPFDVLHESLEAAIGRPVFTHEFGLNWQGLVDELFNGAKPPTLEEIVNMIPEEKRVLVVAKEAPRD